MLNKLRLNLTLLNTIVLVIILLAISIFLYFTMQINLANTVDRELALAAEQLNTYIDYFDDLQEGYPNDPEKDQEYNDFIQKLLNENITTVVWDEEFNVLRSSIYLQLPNNILNDLIKYTFQNDNLGGDAVSYNYDIIDLSIHTNAYANRNGELRVVQTVKNMSAEVGFLDWLFQFLIIAMVIGVTLSFVGGYILSGRTIVPIRKSIQKQQEFVANVSHELRTPIAVVLTNLDVVKSAPKEPVEDQMVWLDNAYDETKRMEKVVGDLLFLAKADAGQLNLEKEYLDLSYLITNTSERLMPLAAKKNISIYNTIDERTRLYADKMRLTQLVIILLDNAIKYSLENTTITISTKEERGLYQLRFKDQGVGIPVEDLDKVYERFYRADKARSREMGGTGLGLSIAKWIADEHDWRLEISSEAGQGTMVRLWIPRENIRMEE
ncbi:sensor histidine kinase [Alkalibacter rhizosphaerae]|uniref:histidine kinase n=1 Tax=Alkalibacter rhizosphaerae TaxID=2815577 RepID=A0A974XGU4_9FIRM|nr:ATP-binding protein [Alkalibacter rhizosphaerae]QSX08058.1 sensor histidine kinase [Alkalibacter rhizosphaerae]